MTTAFKTLLVKSSRFETHGPHIYIKNYGAIYLTHSLNLKVLKLLTNLLLIQSLLNYLISANQLTSECTIIYCGTTHKISQR